MVTENGEDIDDTNSLFSYDGSDEDDGSDGSDKDDAGR